MSLSTFEPQRQEEERREKLREAIAAGEAVLKHIEPLIKSLDRAENLGNLVAFVIGLLLQPIAALYMEKAQAETEALRPHLERFIHSLYELESCPDMSVEVNKPGPIGKGPDHIFGANDLVAYMDTIAQSGNQARRVKLDTQFYLRSLKYELEKVNEYDRA